MNSFVKSPVFVLRHTVMANVHFIAVGQVNLLYRQYGQCMYSGEIARSIIGWYRIIVSSRLCVHANTGLSSTI